MDDEALALALQVEYDREIINLDENWVKDDALNPYSSIHRSQFRAEPTPKSIVDPAWELLEPNPDIRALFQEFNATYFWGKLSMVELKWSPRMTLCAGLCCYEGRGGLCSIRLSQPLLRLRPRKDLVETLLHEMIHALLFITDNNKDHDGHGPEFCKHMKRINAASGTNITIYHNFHDEVDSLRQHWWRCQGRCRTTPPYFGYVRRSMNRAPSPRDPWWPQHERRCGGTYEKVKEPENYGKKKANKKTAKPAVEKGTADITPFLSQVTKSPVGDSNTTSLNANELTSTTSAAKTEQSGSGHRLGGTTPSQTNNRGIPTTSRLLNFQATQSNNHQFENVRSEAAVAPNDRKSDDIFAVDTLTDEKLTDKNKWTKLLTTKRRSLTAGNEIPTKRRKGDITIPELVSRMNRKRQNSVSAGAPAFHMTPPVTNFSKNAIHFQDSEGSQSEKENRMEITAKVKLKKEFPSRAPRTSPLLKSSLPSFDSDNEDSCVLGDRTTLKRQDHNLMDVVLDDPDDCLPKVEFVKNNILSDLDLNENERKTQPLESSTNGRFFGKRLPSFSDDDESETLTEIWKNSSRNSEMPLNKKFKPNDENLPEICFKDPDQHSKTDLQNLPGTSKNGGSSDDVPCPICNEMCSVASINYHIDDCLSLKAIRDSTFG